MQDLRKVRVKPHAQQRGSGHDGVPPATPWRGEGFVHPEVSGWEAPHSHRGCSLILKGDLSLWEAWKPTQSHPRTGQPQVTASREQDL